MARSPARTFCFVFTFMSVGIGAVTADAQSLYQPGQLDRLSDVVQFGVPRDAQFVFCDGAACPGRSIKHLHIAPPATSSSLSGQEAQRQPHSVPLATELSRANVEGIKPIKKRYRKRSTPHECKPVTHTK